MGEEVGADTGSIAESTNSVSSTGASRVSSCLLLVVFQAAVNAVSTCYPNAAIIPAFFVVFNYSIPERSDEVKKAQRELITEISLNWFEFKDELFAFVDHQFK